MSMYLGFGKKEIKKKKTNPAYFGIQNNNSEKSENKNTHSKDNNKTNNPSYFDISNKRHYTSTSASTSSNASYLGVSGTKKKYQKNS